MFGMPLPFYLLAPARSSPVSAFLRPAITGLSIDHVDRPSLERFIVLSLLLHVLVVLLFGDANDGGERRGVQLWGAFRATLVSGAGETGPGLKIDHALSARRPPDNSPSIASMPARGAPILPASSPAEVPAITQDGAPPAPLVPGKSPTAEVLPYIAREVVKSESTFVVPPPTSIPEVVAPVADRRVLPPLLPLQTVEPVAEPKPLREITPYIAPKPREETPVMSPLLPLPPTAIERESAPAQLLPRILPVAPTPALTPLTPAKIEREYTPIAEPLPRLPAVTPPASEPTPLAPARIQREYAPIAEPLAPLVPVVPPTAERELVPYVAPAAIQRKTASRNESELAPPPGWVPDARAAISAAPTDPLASRRGLTAPSLSSTPAPAAPRLDLDAIRNRARNMPSEGSGPRTVFQFPTPPPQAIKSKDAKIFDKALKRPDCRDAYAGLGLAAVVPLVADAITNKGCKW